MGKKGKKDKKKMNPDSSHSNLPNVSICTPTFNRRPFLKGLISCIAAQDYPKKKWNGSL